MRASEQQPKICAIAVSSHGGKLSAMDSAMAITKALGRNISALGKSIRLLLLSPARNGMEEKEMAMGARFMCALSRAVWVWTHRGPSTRSPNSPFHDKVSHCN